LSGELERVIWGSSSVQRQHARDRAALQRRFSLAESQVIGIGQVTDTAITEAMKVNLVRVQAEHAAPDGAEHYAYIAFRGVLRMASVIDRL
jgi:hypothetical protein